MKEVNMSAELNYATQKWINNPCNPNYWLDSEDATPNGDGTFTMIVVPCKMPYDYVIEMFCDFIGAGKAYEKDKWTKETPWNYWVNHCEKKRAMHKTSEYLIKKLLWNLHESRSVDDFVKWYNKAKGYLKEKYDNDEIDY